MAETKHTPGPWHTGIAAMSLIVYGEDGWAIADAKTFHLKRVTWEAEANARLIASAPELLEALKACDEAMAYMSDYDIPLTLPQKVKDAIAKATGGKA